MSTSTSFRTSLTLAGAGLLLKKSRKGAQLQIEAEESDHVHYCALEIAPSDLLEAAEQKTIASVIKDSTRDG